MTIVDEFIARYRKEFDFYDQAARLTSQLLEARLQAAGIRSIVTYRAKTATRLEPKVRERAKSKNYPSIEAIYEDIVDLAGVRVALYFPEQREEIDAIIRQLFSVLQRRDFPNPETRPTYVKRFSGYWAAHYRVQMHEPLLADPQKRYAEARVEIQVASVLMHAWAEVEHDLVYKPLQGTLSIEEYDILDELNGLVISGELALKRLQSAGEERIRKGKRFSNHYELAAFLLTQVSPGGVKRPEQTLGGVDVLYSLLDALDLTSPEQIAPYVARLHSDLEHRPISEQIVDQLLAENEERYAVYQKVRAGSAADELTPPQSKGVMEALGFFMSEWIKFERAIRELLNRGVERGPPVPSPTLLVKAGVIDGSTAERLEPIRRLRNDVVHGAFAGQSDELFEAGRRLEAIVQNLPPKRGPR